MLSAQHTALGRPVLPPAPRCSPRFLLEILSDAEVAQHGFDLVIRRQLRRSLTIHILQTSETLAKTLYVSHISSLITSALPESCRPHPADSRNLFDGSVAFCASVPLYLGI